MSYMDGMGLRWQPKNVEKKSSKILNARLNLQGSRFILLVTSEVGIHKCSCPQPVSIINLQVGVVNQKQGVIIFVNNQKHCMNFHSFQKIAIKLHQV